MILEEVRDNLDNGNFKDVANYILKDSIDVVKLYDELNETYNNINTRDLIIVAEIVIRLKG